MTVRLLPALTGGLCTVHGLFLLVKLPSAGITAGVVAGDWASWWAAVAQFDGGLLLAVGVFTRATAWVCLVALAVTTPDIHRLPDLVDAAPAHETAVFVAGLALVVLAARRARPLPHRSTSPHHTEPPRPPAPSLTTRHARVPAVIDLT